MAVEPMFDTHAHVLSADTLRYPPSAEGLKSATPPYPVEQLLADMDAAGVSQACAVQRYHYYLRFEGELIAEGLEYNDTNVVREVFLT